MQKLQFDPKEYKRIKHRKEQLEKQIENRVPGNERDIAKRLLEKVSKRLKEYEKTHDIPVSLADSADSVYTTNSINYRDFMNNTQTSDWNPTEENFKFKWHVHFEEDLNYHEEKRSEEELTEKLGILYLIFGSTYQTYFNYHIYKTRLINQVEKSAAFMRVKANVYEDDILICKEITIGFWPMHYGDDRVGDMEWSVDDSTKTFKKYTNGCALYLNKILREMQDLWNSYFDEVQKVPLIAGKNDYHNNIATSMTKERRREVIQKVEKEIDSRQIKKNIKTVNVWVKTYKKYSTLEELLENSGVVYQVEEDAVLIWADDQNDFMKLIDYEEEMNNNIILKLLPN